jgi:DNA-binding PadR family transcriptional regulator
LEDEGLVRAQSAEGRRIIELTEAGQAYVAEHAAELKSPWSTAAGEVPQGMHELRESIGGVMGAAMQVAQIGTADQVDSARSLLDEARRRIYLILAAEPGNPKAQQPADGTVDPG